MKRKPFNPLPNFTEDRVIGKKASKDPFEPSSVEPPGQQNPPEPPPQKGPREKRTGHEPDARALAAQTLIDGNPVLWLREQFRKQRLAYDPDVRRYIERLFERLAEQTPGGLRSLTYEQAALHNERLYVEIVLASLQHEMVATKPSGKAFFTLSKSSSLWLMLRRKLNAEGRVTGKGRDSRRTVPAAPTALDPHEDDQDQEADVDTA